MAELLSGKRLEMFSGEMPRLGEILLSDLLEVISAIPEISGSKSRNNTSVRDINRLPSVSFVLQLSRTGGRGTGGEMLHLPT